jgi:pyroglutamyl-peptidase
MRVLMTSFEPFGGLSVNASLEVGRALARRPPRGIELDWMVLPVVAGVCVEQAERHARAMRADVVLALGQAAGAQALRLETRAVNLDQFRIPDNAGNQFVDRPIVAGGPSFLTSSLPLGRAIRALDVAGLPVERSFSAGNFVCNHLFYQLLHSLGTEGRSVGFIHLPLLPGQVGPEEETPTMALEAMVAGLRRVLRTLRGD